jgi:hypothetical protein
MVPRNPSRGLGDIAQQFDIRVSAEDVEPITGVRDRKAFHVCNYPNHKHLRRQFA